jgi:basic membrane protein A and related proteins
MKRFIVLVALLLIAVMTVSAQPKFKIGLVFDLAGRGDNSFNDSAYRGLVAIAKEFKGYIDGDPANINYGDQIQIKYIEPKAGGQDREILMRALAQDGYQYIIGVGFLFTDAITKVAADFPDLHFAIIDGFVPDLTASSNITCLGFKEQEGSFLVGAIAGLMNKGKPVGFLGGMDIPLIHKFEAGFKAGAMYVNPKLRKDGMILSQYIGKDPSAFNDPTGGYNIASSFYKQGASIIYHASGASGDGLVKAAQENKKWAIGVDSDQGLIYETAKEAGTRARGKWILTSMMKRVDNAVLLSGEDFINNGGKLDGGYRSYGLKENGVGYAVNKFNKSQLAPIQARIEKLRKNIIDGKIQVPDSDDAFNAWMATLN